MVENSRGSWKHRKTPLEQFAMRKMLVSIKVSKPNSLLQNQYCSDSDCKFSESSMRLSGHCNGFCDDSSYGN